MSISLKMHFTLVYLSLLLEEVTNVFDDSFCTTLFFSPIKCSLVWACMAFPNTGWNQLVSFCFNFHIVY